MVNHRRSIAAECVARMVVILPNVSVSDGFVNFEAAFSAAMPGAIARIFHVTLPVA